MLRGSMLRRHMIAQRGRRRLPGRGRCRGNGQGKSAKRIMRRVSGAHAGRRDAKFRRLGAEICDARRALLPAPGQRSEADIFGKERSGFATAS